MIYLLAANFIVSERTDGTRYIIACAESIITGTPPSSLSSLHFATLGVSRQRKKDYSILSSRTF